MNSFCINSNKLNREWVALNLCRDERGYYWETESGEDTGARFANVQDAIAKIMNIWCTRYDAILSETVLSQFSSKERMGEEAFA